MSLVVSDLVMATLAAQPPKVEAYRARVVTQAGKRVRGTLDEITNGYLYVSSKHTGYQEEEIPLGEIRKVVIHRVNKKSALISGAVIGGLVTGFLSNESLQKSQTSSPITYGLTLTFAAAGGAAAGLVLGSAIGNLTSRIIRPRDRINPGLSLFYQLEPFTVRYQQNLINRLPKIDP